MGVWGLAWNPGFEEKLKREPGVHFTNNRTVYDCDTVFQDFLGINTHVQTVDTMRALLLLFLGCPSAPPHRLCETLIIA